MQKWALRVLNSLKESTRLVAQCITATRYGKPFWTGM